MSYAPDIIAVRSKNIQLRNEMIHARMAEDLRSKAVLKQAEAARLGYKDGLMRDNEQFKKNVREMMAQSLGELRGGAAGHRAWDEFPALNKACPSEIRAGSRGLVSKRR